MKGARSRFRRGIASMVLVAYAAGCTHMPSGEKAFDSFESCFAANLGLAAAGGVAVGALGTHFVKQFTGSSSAATTVGTTAGIAAAAMIGLTAWRKCAAVYNTSELVVEKSDSRSHQPDPIPATTSPMPAPSQTPAQGRAQASASASAPARTPASAPAPTPTQTPAPAHKPGLKLERLDIKVEGTENDPPVPEFNFSFFAENPAAKDIKAKFRHKVEIVRFMAGENDKLILANAKGEPLLDAAGKPIPLEAATKMPRERLHWVTITDEGKDDYVENVVIQQGQRATYRHKLQIPPRAKLPLPLPVPMRYTLTVEADSMKSTRRVDFALLGTGERPKRFSSSAITTPSTASAAAASASAAGTASKPAESPAASGAAAPATHTARSNLSLYSDVKPPRKTVTTMKKGTRVRIGERIRLTVDNKLVEWARVIPADGGIGGWTQAGNLVEIK